jgi:protein TonB
MNTHTPLPTTSAFVLSLLLHVVVLWKLVPPPLSLPSVGLEPMEIMLVSSATTQRRTPAAAPTPPASRATPTATAATELATEPVGQTEHPRDQVQVAARFDAASLDNPRPVYPLAARRRGLQGGVLLTAHIRADGSCAEVRLARSSGHPLLDTAAVTAVQQWRFLPARRGETPVDSWVNIPITFRLQENG